MSNLTGRHYLLGAIYQCDCRFAHLPSFLNRVAEPFRQLPFERGTVLKQLTRILSVQPSGSSATEFAEVIAIQGDLRRIQVALHSGEACARIETDFNIESSLNQCKDWAVVQFRNLGLPCLAPPIFVVDELPSPYERAGFSALSTDQGDFEQYRIDPGVYFLRSHLTPIYSRYLLLHEMIHYLLGVQHPNEMGRGLEEGICEILGSMLLARRLFGRDLTRNLFIYNRLSSETSQFWELYLDYTRQAAAIYSRYGQQGILELIRSGRPRIKQIEQQLLAGKPWTISVQRETELQDDDLVAHLTFGYGRHLYVSALAYLIHKDVARGATIQEIAARYKLNANDCRDAVRELQDRIYISALRPDGLTVPFSDSPMIFETGALRYALTD
jgi:hypothetical protein